MKDLITANWGWINYVVMLVVPFLVGLLSKTTWHPLLKFGMVLLASAVSGLVTMAVSDLPWTPEAVLPFIVSLVGASEIYYFAFIKSMPAVQQWLASHVVKG